jgi:hypothetical protein
MRPHTPPVLAGAGLCWLLPRIAQAGAQLEEPLIDSVRTALTLAIANKRAAGPEFATPKPAWPTCAGWAR